MTQLHLLELEIDLLALHAFLHREGISGEDADLSYGIHAWLRAAFGEFAPQPWRLFVDKVRPTRILGYSKNTAEELRDRIETYADPFVLRVCPKPELMMASKVMPSWQLGQRLGFQTLFCPIGRKARSGIEKDLFLIRADHKREGLEREAIYAQWVQERFAKFSTSVEDIRLSGFRLVKQIRQTQAQGSKRRRRTITRPQALMDGTLTVGDPKKFTGLLSRGLGRHRAFGYGMILLRPAR
ncbi:MAG TPA: type I-E CRISPR-associated protein Cas6/Cse3/CasE [Firmicutes bacterium]|nr:type I-E CRISPR-associated protein Cas6/Cse3/CasE [Bacillota bacterium]